MENKMLKDVLKQARLDTSLKQSDIAERMGVTPQTYLKWENGRSEPKASQVGKLSSILKVSPEEICRGEVYKNVADPLIFMRKIAVLKNTLDEVTFTSILSEFINDQIGFIEKLERELHINERALQQAEYEMAMRERMEEEARLENEARMYELEERKRLEEEALEEHYKSIGNAEVFSEENKF